MFHFKLTYFKPNGKYYSDAVVEWNIACCVEHPEVAYLNDAVAKLRGLKNTGGSLPGLMGSWEGPILIRQARPIPGFEGSKSSDEYYSAGHSHLVL